MISWWTPVLDIVIVLILVALTWIGFILDGMRRDRREERERERRIADRYRR